MLQYPRAENLPITRKARQIIVPKLDLRDATVMEAVEFIRGKAVGDRPEHRGFNIVVNMSAGEEPGRVTLADRDPGDGCAPHRGTRRHGTGSARYVIVFSRREFAARMRPAAGNPAMWPGSRVRQQIGPACPR